MAAAGQGRFGARLTTRTPSRGDVLMVGTLSRDPALMEADAG